MNLLEWSANQIKEAISRPEYLSFPPDVVGNRSLGQRVEGDWECSVFVTNLGISKPCLVLNFLRCDKKTRSKPLRIPVLIGGEERLRTEDGRDMMKLIRGVQRKKQKDKESSFICHILYVTRALSVKDIEAQIALRLLQEGAPDFSDLIKIWLARTFRRANGIDDLSKIVEYLRIHLFLPEDWRSFRKYVKKIADRFASQRRKIIPEEDEDLEMGQDQTMLEDEGTDEIEETVMAGGLYPVPSFMKILGIPTKEQEKTEGMLYRWAREGKIIAVKKKGVLHLDLAEVRQLWERKEQRKALTKLVVGHKGIDSDSARRWIKRLENKGLSSEEIIGEAKKFLRF
jgi:hypothetical protein